MDDEKAEVEVTEATPEKPGKHHKGLGLRILLAPADELKQRDVERLMREFRLSKLGDSTSEYHGKLLRAALALKTAWIREIEPALKPEDVDSLHPAKVKWLATQVDILFIEVTTVPPE